MTKSHILRNMGILNNQENARMSSFSFLNLSTAIALAGTLAALPVHA